MPIAHNGSASLHWQAHGAGEPVLMIMGLGASSQGWWRLLPAVSERFAPIVFDNRGTGRSGAIEGRLSIEDMVADSLAVLDAAGCESAHVVGASMGGMIAQHLALAHRDRVRSLALCCTTSVSRGGQPPWRLLAGAALRPFVEPGATDWLIAPALYSARTREQFPERMREDLELSTVRPANPRTMWVQMAAIARHDTRQRLRDLAGIPITVIHGDEDVLIPTDRGRALAASIPGARLVVVEQAGHFMTTDAQEESAAALVEHLELASRAEAA